MVFIGMYLHNFRLDNYSMLFFMEFFKLEKTTMNKYIIITKVIVTSFEIYYVLGTEHFKNLSIKNSILQSTIICFID